MKYNDFCYMLHEEATIAIKAGVCDINGFRMFLSDTFNGSDYVLNYEGDIRAAWNIEYRLAKKQYVDKVKNRAWALDYTLKELVFKEKKLTEEDFDEVIGMYGFRRIPKE